MKTTFQKILSITKVLNSSVKRYLFFNNTALIYLLSLQE